MIDAAIPIFFRIHQEFSLCSISVKLTAHSNNDLPRIAILVDYGLDTSKVTATITPGWTSPLVLDKPQCLRIYAAGLTSDTFKFLKNQDFSHILKELVTFEGPPEPSRKIGACIRKHMEFGSTANTNSMVWEMDI